MQQDAVNHAAAAHLKAYGIGLTGGIGTGKSTVARLLAQRSLPVIDADQLARAVTAPGSPGLAAIRAAFGPGVLTADQTLDRKGLGRIIFADPKQREVLEAITHPLIRQALLERVAVLSKSRGAKPFFYEAALIFETNTADAYRAVWATYCPPEVQRARIMQRDQLDQTAAEAIMASQMSARAKADLAAAVIDTSSSLAEVERQLESLLHDLGKG